MAEIGITVLKRNAPWGPFTREQIADGLRRGDFTLAYLACAPGLSEWLPLGEVLDYVERQSGRPESALPKVPFAPSLPPIPQVAVAREPKPPEDPPTVVRAPVASPPVLPSVPVKEPESPSPKPQAPPIVHVPPPKPEVVREMEAGSFFKRGIAFLVDCGILFIPVLVLFVLGALSILVPGWIHHTKGQAQVEDWALLWQNMRRMAWLLAVGCGWLYAAGYESSERQATIGKRWMGLKVTDARGERLTFLRASGRYAAKYLSALPCFLGFIMALFSSRGLAFHDRLSDTRVVKE